MGAATLFPISVIVVIIAIIVIFPISVLIVIISILIVVTQNLASVPAEAGADNLVDALDQVTGS